jgi:hypothetical protein
MHRHLAIPQLQLDLNRMALCIEHFNAKRALNQLAFHLFGNRRGSDSCPTIDARAYKKVRLFCLGQTK